MTPTTSTTWFRDPEGIFEFAQVPNDIPERFVQPLYDRLWSYWLEHCRTPDRAGVEAARQMIAAKQNGWCSVANLRDAGYTEFGQPMVPEVVVREELQKILATECPC